MFCLFLSCTVVFSQLSTTSNNPNATVMNVALQYDGVYIRTTERDSAIEGNVYLFSSWDGSYEIYVPGNKGYSMQNLNYNIKDRILESKISKDSVFQFDIEKINFIKHDGKKYDVLKVNDGSELVEEIFVTDNVSFVKRFNVVLSKSVVNPLLQISTQNDVYSINKSFFLKVKEKDFVEVKLNKRSVLKLLADKSGEIKRYASDLKLGYTSENDLIKIFRKYDSL